jgi:hypothetical protein
VQSIATHPNVVHRAIPLLGRLVLFDVDPAGPRRHLPPIVRQMKLAVLVYGWFEGSTVGSSGRGWRIHHSVNSVQRPSASRRMTHRLL